MALVLADRIKETTTTTGTGTITLAGASTGFSSFAAVGNGNTTYYTIAGQGTSEWEVGIGTYTSSGTTLSRDTVLASSAGGTTKVTFSAGTKDVFVTYPAGKSVNQDANGGVTINAATSGNTLNVKKSNGTSALYVQSGGGIVVSPPLSGFGMQIYGTADQNAFEVYGDSTTGQSYGIYIAAGTNSTDGPLWIKNYSGTDAFRVNGAGTATVYAPATGAPGLKINGSATTPTVAVTFSATAMTLDCTRSNVFTTTFTANVTTAPTISNPQDGQTINWFITQDATGSRLMTWPTSFKWPGASAGVLSTAANSVDLLVATYRSSTGFWYASLSKGFA